MRSVRRAGERVGLSQSATSHALDRLRKLLGDELLVRTASGMEPTPPFDEATAYLEANLDHTLDAGDHTIMVGRVVSLRVVRVAAPLIYYRSGYRSLA